MDSKKYLSLVGLTEYDALIKAAIKASIDEVASNKQDKVLIVTQGADDLASHTPTEILECVRNSGNVVFYDGNAVHSFLEGDESSVVFYSSFIDTDSIQFTIYQVTSSRTIHSLQSNYTPPVESVNGKTGAVELTASDVGADAQGSAAQALTDAREEISTLASKVAYIDENDNETVTLTVDIDVLATLVGGDV